MATDDDSTTRPMSPARAVFVFSVVTLAALVVWVAVRAAGPSEAGTRETTVVIPSMATVPTDSPPPSLSPTATPSASPSASASKSHSPSPTVHKTSKKAKATPTHTTEKSKFSARLSVNASWNGGYVAFIRLTNTGSTTASWRVSVYHDGGDIQLSGVWSARGTQQGSTFVLTGDDLAPGKTITFGYQAGQRGHGPGGGGGGGARPSGCSVVGGSCSVS